MRLNIYTLQCYRVILHTTIILYYIHIFRGFYLQKHGNFLKVYSKGGEHSHVKQVFLRFTLQVYFVEITFDAGLFCVIRLFLTNPNYFYTFKCK